MRSGEDYGERIPIQQHTVLVDPHLNRTVQRHAHRREGGKMFHPPSPPMRAAPHGFG